MIHIAGFKEIEGHMVRNFVEADYAVIRACEKCSHCNKNYVNKKVEQFGYFECHELHDKLTKESEMKTNATTYLPLLPQPRLFASL